MPSSTVKMSERRLSPVAAAAEPMVGADCRLLTVTCDCD
jgi:hypothetical protein